MSVPELVCPTQSRFSNNIQHDTSEDTYDEDGVLMLRCQGDGLCVVPPVDERLQAEGFVIRLCDCEHKCTLSSCTQCSRREPQWYLNSFEGMCFNCFVHAERAKGVESITVSNRLLLGVRYRVNGSAITVKRNLGGSDSDDAESD